MTSFKPQVVAISGHWQVAIFKLLLASCKNNQLELEIAIETLSNSVR